MTSRSESFVGACTELVGQLAVNQALANSVVEAFESGRLTPDSGPMGISDVLKGFSGTHQLKAFLKEWGGSARHLGSDDVASTLRSSLACYWLAQGRAHTVDPVWTGPEVAGSEVRRTEAVAREIIAGAKEQLLIVGYWLFASSAQIRSLIELLIDRARNGVQIRFVLDPGEKIQGSDNFKSLDERWAPSLSDAPRSVFSWSDKLARVTGRSGEHYERKLHAKVIVADRTDALVTSANLTQAGLLENLEMGLRIKGTMAGAVVKHFDLLIDDGILERR
jgi:cardiolipin synthase A/B